MSDRADFLVEIGTEELPPKALRDLSDAFQTGVEQGLGDAAVRFESIQPFATPRRLALVVYGVETRQADQAVEQRGPPRKIAFDEDKPTKAALAFAKRCGVAVDGLEILETDKGAWLVHRATQPGVATSDLLPGIVDAALTRLPIPKRMRWGAHPAEFVRPVHWVSMLMGEEVVDAELFGLKAGRLSFGHRFHAPDPISIERPADYPELLRAAYVEPDYDRRRASIEQAARDAVADGEAVLMDPAVLDEVTALVEWPLALAGRFDNAFLELPPPVLIATLQSHQRYFPVTDRQGGLIARFVAISNIDSREPEKVRAGNERVVRPRLADAKFFFDQDRRAPLGALAPGLAEVVYQSGLGSLYDRTERLMAGAAALAEATGTAAEPARRAAQLAKCDLLSGVVGEFPELQGFMGGYYAALDGEPESVATAIGEQYWPRFAGDRIPASEAGRVLSLADKLETLTGIFAIGQRPSGARDPFGLRRAALGVLRVLIEGQIDLDLRTQIQGFLNRLPVEAQEAEVDVAVFDYVLERLRGYYSEAQPEGVVVTPHILDAVLAVPHVSPWDVHQRVLAVAGFGSLDAAAALAGANKRIANILKKDPRQAHNTELDTELLVEADELALHEAMLETSSRIEPALAAREYTRVMSELAALRGVVDAFFGSVLVMAEDDVTRNNRLALLERLRALFLRVADISRLPGR